MMWVEIWLTSQSPYDIQKTSQKYLLQILQICNKLFPNLFAIAICNKRNLIALQFICNKPVIYWLMSGPYIKIKTKIWIGQLLRYSKGPKFKNTKLVYNFCSLVIHYIKEIENPIYENQNPIFVSSSSTNWQQHNTWLNIE